MALKPQIFAALFLVTGAVGGFLATSYFAGNGGSPTADEPEILYWVGPMDPSYRADGPGTSPMGMELVPVYAEDAASGEQSEPSLQLSSAVINNIGVRTAPVERRTMHANVRTVGNVQPNEELTHHVHVRASGWIETLAVRAAGEEVSEGDLLFQYYAPDLVNAQAEFVQAVGSGRNELVSASQERLQALGMSDEQIAEVRRTRTVQQLVDIRAPQDGVVIVLNVGEGMYVQPGMTLMSLADLSSVWVLVDVFEDDAPRMITGLRATMRLPFFPGREWEGQVDYVYPTIDPVSRTLRVRLVFLDIDRALMPNMYGDIEIEAQAREGVLVIPSQALIRSSKGDRVVLSLGEGRFRPARVVAGLQSGDYIEILSGLREGETIVTSSQFLIDSEASLDASLLRLSLEGERMAEPAAAMDMAEPAAAMDMGGMTSMEEPQPAIIGRGVIENIMVDHKMIRLAYEPIAALGWPAMTMNFTFSDELDVEGFRAGQYVEFTLAEVGGEGSGQPGDFVVSSILGLAADDAEAVQ